MEKSRKHQLINAVKNFLADNGGDYAFSKNPRMNQFNAYCFGEIRRETLLGLILTNNGIEVTTYIKVKDLFVICPSLQTMRLFPLWNSQVLIFLQKKLKKVRKILA